MVICHDKSFHFSQSLVDEFNKNQSIDHQKIPQILKILKRELKGEVTEDKLKKIKNAFNKLKEIEGIEKISDFRKLRDKITKGDEILKNRKQIEQLQKECLGTIQNATHEHEYLLQNPNDDDSLKMIKDHLSTIYKKIHLRNELVNVSDLIKLNQYLKIVDENPSADQTLKELLKTCIEAIENTVLNKIKLLTILRLKKQIDEKIVEKEEIDFILSNPTEMAVDLKNLIESFKQSTIQTAMEPKIKALYQNILNTLFEQHPGIDFKLSLNDLLNPSMLCRESDSTKTLILTTFEEKIAMLKFMIKYRHQTKTKDHVLIAGGGPGGLMSALISILQGHKKVTILEIRKENDQMRQNIVTLGKEWDPNHQKMLLAQKKHGVPADIALLNYFGVIDDLEEKKQVTKKFESGVTENPKSIIQLRIEDIQKTLLTIAQEIGQDRFEIQYNASIESIGKNRNGGPSVTYKIGDQAIICSPEVTYVMEGHHSKTRDLLGISTIKESKITRMGVSFYEVEQSKSHVLYVMRLVMRFLSLIPKLFSLLRESIATRFHCYTPPKSYKLFLYIPQEQSFYFTMTSEQETQVKIFEDRIKIAKESNRASEADNLKQQLDDFLRSISANNYYLETLTQKISGKAQTIDLGASYLKTTASISQIQRAETNHVQIGDMHFVLGGDAESTTDPMSGSGLRTTLLRASIATLSYSENLAQNQIGQILYQQSAELEASSMREEGFHARVHVHPNSLRIERYLSLAKKHSLIDQKEFNELLSIQGKIKNIRDGLPVKLTRSEKSLVERLRTESVSFNLTSDEKKTVLSKILGFLNDSAPPKIEK